MALLPYTAQTATAFSAGSPGARALTAKAVSAQLLLWRHLARLVRFW